jgi:hypothetical protein
MNPMDQLNVNYRRSVFCSVILALILALFLLPAVFAQTQTAFAPTEKFRIPEYNGIISFATIGSYSYASLENDCWNFVNLNLNNSQQLVNLTISAQYCNVTVLQYQTFNVGISNTSLGGVFMTYAVEGQGKQTLRFNLNLKGGEWSVSLNGDFVGKNEGWTISPNDTLVITGARDASNVTIAYFNFSGSFGGNRDTSNQPFYQQHSVIISTAVAVAVVFVLTVAIWKKKKTLSQNISVRTG